MSVFKCKMCGGTLDLKKNQSIAVCEYCGTTQTLPKQLDNERRANLYDRANHFRRNNEYDKAMGIYEQILSEDTSDAEAYWSLVLCRYGIEYVEDPVSHNRIPTVNRAQFTSIFDDADYRSALQHADAEQKEVYEQEAAAINEIQKCILEISQKEEPYDVFICYKETGNDGRRTPDSVLATDLYHQLTKEGFKVFFSRITLEDKLGTAYEPYIFAALNSARVMVVLGTKAEYFNAVWVKNEWSRYLALVKQSEGKKMLIPAYRDMDPYDLPEEFSHLQAQDMGKLGFMQDLIRGIKKILTADTSMPEKAASSVITESGIEIGPLMRRAYLYLEDGDWQRADEYCEKVLDRDPEHAEAYLGKLMAEVHCRTKEELRNLEVPFDGNNNFQKVLRFGGNALKEEITGYIEFINDRNTYNRLMRVYKQATEQMNRASDANEFKKAADLFKSIPGFQDADAYAQQCAEKAETMFQDAVRKHNGFVYNDAVRRQNDDTIESLEEAVRLYNSIPDWEDANIRAQVCRNRIAELKVEEDHQKQEAAVLRKKRVVFSIITVVAALVVFGVYIGIVAPACSYQNAVELMESGKNVQALKAFTYLGNYKDSKELAQKVTAAMQEDSRHTIAANANHTVGIESDGTVKMIGENFVGEGDVSGADWTDIVDVDTEFTFTVGVKSNGKVIATGTYLMGDQVAAVSDWHDIVAVSVGDDYVIGLRKDGTVVATGSNYKDCSQVEDWSDIVAVAAGGHCTVGLKSDGTVVATGDNENGQCNVYGWENIVAVAVSNYSIDGHTVGLKSDGTVVATGYNDNGQCDVDEWTDIIAVSAGRRYTVGLKSDGTVVATGNNANGQCNVSDWTDIVAIATGWSHTVGIKSDGTAVATGWNADGQCNVSDWHDMKTP